ncbi:hypothetical protein EXU29_02375 [Acinetobacter wuhouensis]|uniref:hypothetical protein n=1 Tax=Acinetobacter wuhouensis TaxID=1879050 RepID=UPI001022AC9A|nr:hypothetical protein [Acinetobacter wuhouensis]RZG75195.1 hypothetical protein EXU29_02375 [Acinetobacter wuhouensis]
MNKKQSISLIVILTFPFYVFAFNYDNNKKNEVLDKKLRTVANEEREKLPLDIGNSTTWVKVEYNKFKFKYVYIVDTSKIEWNPSFYKESINYSLKEICNQLKDEIRNDIQYEYEYQDEKNNKLVNFTANKKRCSNL